MGNQFCYRLPTADERYQMFCNKLAERGIGPGWKLASDFDVNHFKQATEYFSGSFQVSSSTILNEWGDDVQRLCERLANVKARNTTGTPLRKKSTDISNEDIKDALKGMPEIDLGWHWSNQCGRVYGSDSYWSMQSFELYRQRMSSSNMLTILKNIQILAFTNSSLQRRGISQTWLEWHSTWKKQLLVPILRSLFWFFNSFRNFWTIQKYWCWWSCYEESWDGNVWGSMLTSTR